MNKLTQQPPLLMAGILSFILSLFLSFNTIVNGDGILYLNAAREFVKGNYQAGFALYGWPFYSLLIAGVSKLSTLSLEFSATLINAGFMGLMASGFVALTREMGASKSLQWLGVFVFLIHPGINYFREYVIRDFGAWAFLLWSLVFLCRYSQKASWLAVLGWTLVCIGSVLFRPEGIVWLALGPMGLFFIKNNESFNVVCLKILKLNSLFLIMGLGTLALLLSLGLDLPANNLSRLTLGNIEYLHKAWSIYTEKSRAFSQIMSVYFEYDDALIVLAFGFLFYGTFLLAKLLSGLYLVLLGYAFVKRPLIQKPEAVLLIWLLVIDTVLLLAFMFKMFFMDARYMVPWVAVAMVWVPFGLAKIWETAPKALKATIALVFLYMFIDSLFSFGYSKMYLKEAGLWIKENTPQETRLYTNSKHVAYYADRNLVDEKNAEIIALRYSRKTATPDQGQIGFHNKRGDGVRIIDLGEISK